MSKVFKVFFVGFFLASFVELAVYIFKVPNYIFPAPTEVFKVFFEKIDVVFYSWAITTFEAVSGFFLSVTVSFLLAVVTLFVPGVVSRTINAAGAVLQSIPLLAMAPLLALWFGQAIQTKIVASSVVCFFPLLTGWLAGFKSVDSESHQLFDNIGAGRFQKTMYLMIPSSLPYFFGGVRVAMPLALLGAIVAEFIGASEGLGFQILNNSYYLRTPEMFAYIIAAALTGTGLTLFSDYLENKLLFWHGSLRSK